MGTPRNPQRVQVAIFLALLIAVIGGCSTALREEASQAPSARRDTATAAGTAVTNSAATNGGSTTTGGTAAAGSAQTASAEAAGSSTGQAATRSSSSELEEIAVTGSRRSSGGRTRPRGFAEPSARMPVIASAEPWFSRNGSGVAPTDAIYELRRSIGASRAARPGSSSTRRALSGVQPGEEIWIIATPSSDRSIGTDDTAPGTGAMLATVPGEAPDAEPTVVPLPLKHTDVRAAITGYISTVDVTQQFENPYDEKIEAVYLFPLPENAAVSEFVMSIGERRIRGILRERSEAEEIYRDARAQGLRASLLTQHRPNIFEQKVANIEPGKRIDVDIRYFHTLAYHDGWYSFVFPTVVGPRYNPEGFDDPIDAKPREHVSARAPGAAVRYLRPSERSAHDLAISVEIDAGVAIEEIDASHEVRSETQGQRAAKVELAADGMIPNRDFILNFRVAGETLKSSLLTYTDAKTDRGYFTLMLYPPADLEKLSREPVEMVFVVDTSGSMSDRPLAQAKEAMLEALDRLSPSDTFQILRFSNSVSQFGPAPVPASAENLRRAKRYVIELEAGGGTEMLAGIRAALQFPRDRERLRFVTFMTDGFIGNDTQVIGEVQRLIGDSRIFSFGVGNSVNRYLLERMATVGRGAVAYLGLDDSASGVMSYFFERISHPALTDVEIDWGAMAASDVYPSRWPDLFVGRPLVVTGRYRGEPGEVRVRGVAGGERASVAVSAEPSDDERSYLANIWARLRIADLVDRQTRADDTYGELARAIRDTALEYGLMSQYTSFVAVDASERTAGDHGTTVHQAVPVPDGVRYDTTVAETTADGH